MSFTDFREVSNPATGTTTKYGSQDLLDIMQIFNGKTVSSRRPRIVNPWLWDSSYDMKELAAAPASPATGYQSVFIDSTDHHLKLKNSTGTITDLSAGGGTGNVSTTASNTYGDFDQIFRSGRLDVRNPANTFSYSITGSAIAANRALTLPLLTADDVVATEAFTQTLTNKTINATNNTITDTSTALGDLLKSNGTKFVRLAKGTGLQYLRTNAGATDLEWGTPGGAGDMVLASAQTNSGAKTFLDTTFLLRNPANTFSATILAGAQAAARNFTFPVTTSDTIVTAAATQTLTNKSIDYNTNTITNLPGGGGAVTFQDFTRTTTPANPAANFARVYCKQIDTNNDGLFTIVKKAGAYVEVQVA